MGCDIHVAVERRYKNGWVPVNPEPCEQPSEANNWFADWGCYSPAQNPVEELTLADIPIADRVPAESYDWNFGRDYDSFAQLANVRGRGGFCDPRGIPNDVSPAVFGRLHLRIKDADEEGRNPTEEMAMQWGARMFWVNGVRYCFHPDWHSVSHYTLEELHAEIDKRGKNNINGRILDLTKAMFKVCKTYKLTQDQVRVVFWFDN